MSALSHLSCLALTEPKSGLRRFAPTGNLRLDLSKRVSHSTEDEGGPILLTLTLFTENRAGKPLDGIEGAFRPGFL